MRLAQDDEHAQLEAWRLHQLLNAGLRYHRAELLATRTDLDLHRVLEMLEKGCDHKTLLRILL
jgi:hypothetical protein